MDKLNKLFRLTAYMRRIPRHAAIAGGWLPLLQLSVDTVKHEGLQGFFRKVNRFANPKPTASASRSPSMADISFQCFDPEAITEIAHRLKFDIPTTPCVTVIIPVFNNARLSIECLAAIQRAPQRTPFEIVVIDDASSDDTADILGIVAGINYLRNEFNTGFIHTCNRAASIARGKYLHFLNNDTQVQQEWLDAMVNHLDKHPSAGLVGSKLLFPNGRLQEAGGRLMAPADEAWGELIGDLIGMGADRFDPRYQIPREVEYCSGASILVRRELFLSLGGFDVKYAPAYFEDVDLAYKVRNAGYDVAYEPRSEVVHHLSASTTSQSGYKQQLIKRNAQLFINQWREEMLRNRRIRLIAFYLPQYHPIPENDAWWGKGFTEWTNVAKAQPNFDGHYQPHLPGELGFYDLRLPEVRQRQAELAVEYGIYGFCYYYYWFNGKRLLQRPLDEVVASGKPDFPFCICWANENWTRTWDGENNQILIAQRHSQEDDIAFISSLFPALRDSRYIRIDNKPLILVYQVDLLPNPGRTADIWRETCRIDGIGEIYLACVHKQSNPALNTDPRSIGFDAAVEFPPLGKGITVEKTPRTSNKKFRGLFYDYAATAKNLIDSKPPHYPFFRGVMPSWDNTARRQDSGNIFLGSTPEEYRRWLDFAIDWTACMHAGDERIVFINAWNEWAEGNHLEPDRLHGHAYLKATRAALEKYLQTLPS